MYDVLSLSALAFVGIFFLFVYPSMRIATGYAAKYVCSSTFLSTIHADRIKDALDFFLVRNVRYSIDHDAKRVEASLWGIATRTAQYYERGDDKGCMLGELSAYDQVYPASDAPTLSKKKKIEPWPQPTAPSSLPNVDIGALNTLLDETYRANKGTLAVLIAHQNQLVAEKYAQGVDEHTRLAGWSLTKSILNALFGILVKQGKIDIHRPTNLPSWQHDSRRDITIEQLLNMSSGLAWNESYSVLSGVTKMLYLEDSAPRFALHSKQKSKPGSAWYYSSGTTNILAEVLRAQFPDDKSYREFVLGSIRNELGMQSAVAETDAHGYYVLSSYGWATARDWTRFGLIYLNNGTLLGKEILSPEWVTFSHTPAPASGGKYGAHFRLNASQEMLPSLPPDAYYASGFGGQKVLIVPSKQTVITVISGMQNKFPFDSFFNRALQCIGTAR